MAEEYWICTNCCTQNRPEVKQCPVCGADHPAAAEKAALTKREEKTAASGKIPDLIPIPVSKAGIRSSETKKDADKNSGAAASKKKSRFGILKILFALFHFGWGIYAITRWTARAVSNGLAHHFFDMVGAMFTSLPGYIAGGAQRLWNRLISPDFTWIGDFVANRWDLLMLAFKTGTFFRTDIFIFIVFFLIWMIRFLLVCYTRRVKLIKYMFIPVSILLLSMFGTGIYRSFEAWAGFTATMAFSAFIGIALLPLTELCLWPIRENFNLDNHYKKRDVVILIVLALIQLIVIYALH